MRLSRFGTPVGFESRVWSSKIACNAQVIEIRPAAKAYNGSNVIMYNGDGVNDVSPRKPTVVIIMIGRKKWGFTSL